MGIAYNELQGLPSLSLTQVNGVIGIISEERAKIMPGLIKFEDTFVMESDREFIFPLQFLSIPLETVVSLCEMSIQDMLRKLNGSPEPFISATTGELLGNASDNPPFCNVILL